MFGVNDVVIYGSTGVCEIVDIGTPDFRGVDKSLRYYTLKPVYGDGVIYSPVDNPRVFIRPVMTKEEARRLIDAIPEINAQAYHNRSTQLLAEHYTEAINSHNCIELLELIMSVYQKRQALIGQKRKLGQVDERFMKRAQSLLYGELAVALEIEREEVEEYVAAGIERRVRAQA